MTRISILRATEQNRRHRLGEGGKTSIKMSAEMESCRGQGLEQERKADRSEMLPDRKHT